MSDWLGEMLPKVPRLRRLTWRIGRRLYAAARQGETVANIENDGEAYLQSCVLRHAADVAPLNIFDIGANRGNWTKSLFAQIPSDWRGKDRLRVHLFEPVPATRERLFQMLGTIDHGGLCRVHPGAMSDQSGPGEMAIMSEAGGTNSLHFDGSASAPPGGWIAIEKQTLTEFCKVHGIDRIQLVKCDAEGHDFRVLEGAKELLREEKIDVFQFEYNHRWIFSRCYLKDVFDLVNGLPYSVGKLGPTSIEIYEAWHPELERFFQSNYVLLHGSALGRFNVRRGTFDISNTYA
jgi:FkbM family methyltransferase